MNDEPACFGIWNCSGAQRVASSCAAVAQHLAAATPEENTAGCCHLAACMHSTQEAHLDLLGAGTVVAAGTLALERALAGIGVVLRVSVGADD